MKTKLVIFINYIQKLTDMLESIVRLNLDKKNLLLSDYKINSLLEIVAREENFSRQLSLIQNDINIFIESNFSDYKLTQKNLTQILNCISEFKEEHDVLSELKNRIDDFLNQYGELKKINTMLLQTESGYYNHILKNIEKETSLKKNTKQRVNLCNTLA